jgi:selenocysteine lyase/cysteine desulfurase
MAIDRRDLLASLAAGAVGARLLPYAAQPAAAAEGAAAFRPRRADGSIDWLAVRAEFDGLARDWIHLASFLFVSHPRGLRAEIERFRALIDSDPTWIEQAVFEDVWGRPYEAARAALAGYLGGRPDEIAFTSNATSALAMAYHGLRIRPDQEILTTEHDHFVHHQSIQYAVERSGAPVRRIPLYERGAAADAGEMVARVERALSPRTRALGITWVHSSTGVRLPVAAIAEVVARANRGRDDVDRCLLVVDGVHGFGNQDVDAAGLGADFFGASLHKWLCGPRGTGFLWGRRDAWRQLRPTIPSFDPLAIAPWDDWMERRRPGPTEASWVSPGGFLAYENFLAIPTAFDFQRAVGRDRVAARVAALNATVREGLAGIPRVTLHTPRDPALAAGITCFEVAGLSPAAVVARLAERKIRATTSPYRVSYARLAAGIMNLPGEIETALAAVRDLAG